tara:strand:- start:1777 stop:2985 length:1209 start_codon:yes stop_codon:yes gene_type:complete
MDIFNKFFTKFAYKLPKGYPDMDNPNDVALLESMFRKMDIDLNLKEAAADVTIRQELIDKNPGFFGTQSDSRRIANTKKISADEFVDIVKKTFDIDEVIIHPPNSGPNKKPATHSSSKFNMFEFEVDGRKYFFILSGGAAANKGQDFEDKIAVGLKNAIDVPLNDIEDSRIKDLLVKLNIDPLNIKSVEQTGGINTKRTIQPDEGATDRGEIISDVILTTNDGTNYYLSIKNKTGDNIYNGGSVSSIAMDRDTGKIEFDRTKFNSDQLKASIFDMFDIDPERLTLGLNNYIDKIGEIPQWEDIDVEDEKIKKLIASAIDYGYYYVREEGNGVKVINLKDANDVDKLIGTLDRAIVKYPGNGVKSTYARVYLKDSEQGLKYVEVQIRNAAGGIGRPSIKIQTK